MSSLGPILASLLLSNEPRLRQRLLLTLTAGGVYLVCLVLQSHSVWAGYVTLQESASVFIFVVLGKVTLYGLIRSGLTLKLRDPAMTMAQMVFALMALALAYRVNTHVRGALLMVVPLVLIFGAFMLKPSRCRALGWAAVGLFAAAMAWGATHEPERIDTTIEWIHFFFVATVLPTISFLAGQLSQLRSRLQVQKRELRDALERLKLLATHDALTGLPNRHHVQEWAQKMTDQPPARVGVASVALIDLDHFKRINDQFGHAAGDAVLRIFAAEASKVLRSRDMLARWGGEEFLLVMPDTSTADAEMALARLRKHLARPEIWADHPQARATFSAGLAIQGPAQSLDEVVKIADEALYKAKHAGRNCVVTA